MDEPTYDVFISYASEDEAWVDGYLVDALTVAGMKVHTEEAFRLGVPRLSEFERAITQSRRSLLVLSPAYLSDNFADFVSLLGQAYGLRTASWPVVPLMLHPVELPLRLSELTALDATNPTDWGEVVARLCRELGAPVVGPPEIPLCPYPGMIPFSEQQSDAFYGRDREIGDALERLRLHPFLTVIGPSGSGKSSLVFAGIIPALRGSRLFGNGDWDVRSMRPGEKPLSELRRVLEMAPTSSEPTPAPPHTPDGKRLLIIDQFEETFTLAGDESLPFQQALLELAEQENLYIVLTVRADFYPDLMGSPLWTRIQARRLEVTPLGEVQLREAIVRPAQDVGVFVESALEERLVADAVGEPGILPLVQETLVLLWERVERRFLPLRAYEALVLTRRSFGGPGFGGPSAAGERTGLQVAIANRADDAYASLSEAGQAIARRIFLRLVQFGAGRADTRRQQPVAALEAARDDEETFAHTLAFLADRRLLTLSGEEGSGPRRVDIAHEALIAGWPRLQEWLREYRYSELTRRRLEEKAAEWVRLGRGSGGLLDEVELREAEKWIATSEAELLGRDKDLLQMVESSRAAIRRSTLLRSGAIALIGLLILVSVGVYALLQNKAAAQERELNVQIQAQLDVSRSREVAAIARTLLDDGEDQTALLLSVAAITQITETVEAGNTLRASLEVWRGVAELPPHQDRTFVVFSDNGQYLASSSTDGAVRLWQLVGNTRYINLEGHTDTITGQVFTPGSRYLVTASLDGTARVWDPATGQLAFPPLHQSGDPDRPEEIKSADLNQDDGSVLVTRGVRSLRVWDLTTGQPLDPEPFSLDTDLRSASIHPTGEFIAAAASDGSAGFWQVSSRGGARKPGSNHTAFSNDGLYWATASDNQLYLWDVQDFLNEIRLPNATLDAPISVLYFSGDGTRLGVGGQDGGVRVWDLRRREREPVNLRGHSEQITSLRFSPDNRYVATTSLDNAARLWHAESGRLEAVLSGHRVNVWSVAFSPDGRRLATADESGEIRLWSVEAGGSTARYSFRNGPVSALALWGERVVVASTTGDVGLWTPRPENSRVFVALSGEEGQPLPQWTALAAPGADTPLPALGGADGRIALLDPESGERVREWTAHSNGLRALLFAGEQTLVSAGGDGVIRLWETSSGQEQASLTGHRGDVNGLALTPDRETLVSAGADGAVRLWHLPTRALSATLPADSAGPPVPLLAVAVSTDGRTIAAGGHGRGIYLWDRSTAPPTRGLLPLSTSVRVLAFSPDGRHLASGDETGNLRLWDLERKKAVLVGARGSSWLTGVAFSGDGSRLYAADQAGTVREWPVSTEELVALACDRVLRDLTPGEREEHAPFLDPDQPTCPDIDGLVWTPDSSLDLPRAMRYPVGDPHPVGDSEAAALPEIYYFDALSGTVAGPDEPVILRWRVGNATAVYLEYGGRRDGVISPDVRAYRPEGNTTYRLVAENGAGRRERELTIFIRRNQ